MKPGDHITVYALHADGQWYRRWPTTVESIGDGCVVTYSPAGSSVEDIGRGQRTLPRAIRSYYWFDRLYNLLEVFTADGALDEVYINVAGPPHIIDGGMAFVDYELDVMKLVGQPAVILDEDEFEAAVAKFGYTIDFVTRCRTAVEEARDLADRWPLTRSPAFF